MKDLTTTTEQLLFCSDCHELEFNPDRTWLDYSHNEEEEANQKEEQFEPNKEALLEAISDNRENREFMHFTSTDDRDEFATTGCALCGTTLGGPRHTVEAVFKD